VVHCLVRLVLLLLQPLPLVRLGQVLLQALRLQALLVLVLPSSCS
jgi:hypothetical protein